MMFPWRTIYYKIKYQYILRRARFGEGTRIYCKLIIKGPGKVHVGSTCRFDSDPWGDDMVTLFTHHKNARIHIGNRVTLRATRFGSFLRITIRDDVIIENASIYDSDFHNIDATKRNKDFNKGDKAIIIDKGTYVGCECLLSKGTTLSSKSIMLPTSVLGTKTVSSNTIILGNPGRALK